MSPIQELVARQTTESFVDGDEFFDGRPVPYWYTREGQIIRWSIFFGIFVALLLYIVVGYWHAKSRIKKGLSPLAYHRWLLNRETRIRHDPSYNPPNPYHQEYPPPQYGYGMNSMPMPMPPPLYDPNAPLPPTYQPPAGGSKIDPSQYRTQPTRRPAESSDDSPAYEPPASPPPAALPPHNPNMSNNPYRF
ncbi:hypothetical protein PVAG01_06343 [Phlyctema vagabunda]|uniref:Uncharacterized protein n=1 Tax=Phlyctema vagabunda TaxID=108571 RepID=A0ABR4PFS7_9HELO